MWSDLDNGAEEGGGVGHTTGVQGRFHLYEITGQNFPSKGTVRFFFKQNGTGRTCSFGTEMIFFL